MWVLKGFYQGKKFEQLALDIDYLKQYLTLVLRRDGSGFIYREN